MNQKIKIFFLSLSILFLQVLLVYVVNITSMPESIILFQNETLSLRTAPGITLQTKSYHNINLDTTETEETIEASSQVENAEDNFVGKVEMTANLFGIVDVKEITVNVIENAEVVPLGNIVGLKLYTDGVLVVGMSEISGNKPYEEAGIKEGDRIIEINEKTVTCTADLVQNVNDSNGEKIQMTYIRDGQEIETSIKPVEVSSNNYKIGLWVRDTAAGVGTVSYYEPSTNSFAALGHGIMDVDTEELINIASGEFITTNILSITKGEEGNPGKIQGTIENQASIGNISKNTPFGVFGTLKNAASLNVDLTKTMKVAMREEIQTGKASIICTLENNVRKEYEVEIQKIFKDNNSDNKSMVIKVTDQELLDKTGGIIQGMSGSPIVQNGKFVGALTHVLVSDPTKGYGVFADMMIKQSREVK